MFFGEFFHFHYTFYNKPFFGTDIVGFILLLLLLLFFFFLVILKKFYLFKFLIFHLTGIIFAF